MPDLIFVSMPQPDYERAIKKVLKQYESFERAHKQSSYGLMVVREIIAEANKTNYNFMQQDIETQVKALIEQWRSMSDRPVDKDWVHNNMQSDQQSMQEVSDMVTSAFTV